MAAIGLKKHIGKAGRYIVHIFSVMIMITACISACDKVCGVWAALELELARALCREEVTI